MPVALLLALAKAGSSRPARMAMIAMTTSSSMSVNACLEFFFMAKSLKRRSRLPQVWRAGNQPLGVLSLSPCPKDNDSSLQLEIERAPNPEQLNLVILGDADTKVVIQYSDDLIFWEAIGGEIPLQEGKFTLSILEDGKQLFYRVLKPGE